jgi:hypothetical protein
VGRHSEITRVEWDRFFGAKVSAHLYAGRMERLGLGRLWYPFIAGSAALIVLGVVIATVDVVQAQETDASGSWERSASGQS